MVVDVDEKQGQVQKLDDCANQVEIESVGMPLEINQVLHVSAPENVKVVCIRKDTRREDIVLSEFYIDCSRVFIDLFLVVRTNYRKQINRVFYFVHFFWNNYVSVVWIQD